MVGRVYQIIKFLETIDTNSSFVNRLEMMTGLSLHQHTPDTPDTPATLRKIDYALNVILNSKEREKLEEFLSQTHAEEEIITPFRYVPQVDNIGDDEPTLSKVEPITEEELAEDDDLPTMPGIDAMQDEEDDNLPTMPGFHQDDENIDTPIMMPQVEPPNKSGKDFE